MMVSHYDPVHGWSAPEIKPYGPFAIDPASSCLQYATNVFEGMKVRLHCLSRSDYTTPLILLACALRRYHHGALYSGQ